MRAKSACGAPGCRTDSGVCRRECDFGPVGLVVCENDGRVSMVLLYDFGISSKIGYNLGVDSLLRGLAEVRDVLCGRLQMWANRR